MQTIDGVSKGGLPAAGLTGQPEDFAAPEFEADVLDGMHWVFGFVNDIQVPDGQHRPA